MQTPTRKSSDALGRRIYLRSVYGRWKRAVAKGFHEIRVFSPYLTSKAAERVVMAAVDPEACEIYTRFEVEDFVSGASSIKTLRRLKEAKFPLYELPNLHAKLVVIKGKFATIGSQNLTVNGTRRWEATFVTTKPKEVERLWSDTEVWRGARKEITLEMIQDMEALIPSLAGEYEAFKKKCEEAAEELRRAEEKRRLEREAARIALELAQQEDAARIEREQREARIKEARERANERWKAELRKSTRIARARVDFVQENRYDVWSSSRYSLRPTDGSDLTRWRIGDDRTFRLMGQYRYPCLIHGTWKVGFARVNKTCITFVEKSITHTNEQIGGLSITITFTANWSDLSSDCNITCELKMPILNWQLNVPAWFGLTDIELRDPVAPVESTASENFPRSLAWYNRNQVEIKEKLLELFLSPFQYKKNLTGVQAQKFFGETNSVHLVQAAEIRTKPVLVVTRIG